MPRGDDERYDAPAQGEYEPAPGPDARYADAPYEDAPSQDARYAEDSYQEDQGYPGADEEYAGQDGYGLAEPATQARDDGHLVHGAEVTGQQHAAAPGEPVAYAQEPGPGAVTYAGDEVYEPDVVQDGGRVRGQREDLGDPATWTRLRDAPAGPAAAMALPEGPWDAGAEFPDQPRIDFGSILVPVREGFDVQVLMSEQEGISVAVVRGDSGLQLQPFAAPRSSGLWPDVMPEIAQEVAKAGGQSSEQQGPFGPELVASVAPQGDGADATAGPQPLRFMGADGPRWFLRGLISGPAAADSAASEQFREIFADVVVVRGEHAEPPRKPLAIQLPAEALQAMEGEEQLPAGLTPGGQSSGSPLPHGPVNGGPGPMPGGQMGGNSITGG